MSPIHPARVALLAVVGLACTASAQSLTLEFRADRTQAAVGETVHWKVYQYFDGYSHPNAHFYSFVGAFVASEPAVGLSMNFYSSLGINPVQPHASGASVESINTYFWCGNLCDYFYSGVPFFNFDVEIAIADQPLWYDAVGVAGVRADDGIFTLPDEYRREIGGLGHNPFNVITDIVNNRGCGPADFAAPFGVHDAADITRFVELFLDRAPIIDFAEPLGVYDLADIVAFVEGYIDHRVAADIAEPFDVWDMDDLAGFVDGFTGGCP